MRSTDDAQENMSDGKTQGTSLVVQKCDICNGKVERVAGDVIFGDKWYHNSCWKSKKTSKTQN
ncbi:MAG: hypothetical protein AUH84_03670 [Thaumarchaeota archaeon 13_1_40CM_4_38_7]|nr:MAG: hypothetical protein AUH84_03670 [Thaumarchaeota archaeon 13_1_40CM_4_38_7]